MAEEFIIKSEAIEDKINQLLPSQGGFQAGVDFSASTMVIPIVDLTETAEGLMALEFIMEKLQSPSLGGDGTPSGKITEAGLREMMQDERYWHPARRNNDFIQEVNDGFQKLYNR